jgi:hypothetical protein
MAGKGALVTKMPSRSLALGLLLSSSVLLAEVSVDPTGGGVNTLMLGVITDDSDPIGIWTSTVRWRPIKF